MITDLFNYAFPILRYDNGDTAVATRKEKNGRYRLYLDELYGRRSDLIYDCEGKAVTPYIITNNLWDIEGVKQYRFIQEDVKDYTIWLNGDPQKMNQEEILGRIRRIWVKKPESGWNWWMRSRCLLPESANT